MRSNSGDNRSRAASAMALIRCNGWSRGTCSSRSAMARRLRGGGATAYQGLPVAKGNLFQSPPFFSSLPRFEDSSGCSLNPIMIANAGAGDCHVLGSIRSRPCTGLWRNGSSAGRNKGREMQRCAAACGVAHAVVGRDGGGLAGSGPYRPDHGCVGLATALRGYILDLSKEDGWPHDHPVYRSHIR